MYVCVQKVYFCKKYCIYLGFARSRSTKIILMTFKEIFEIIEDIFVKVLTATPLPVMGHVRNHRIKEEAIGFGFNIFYSKCGIIISTATST